MFFSAIWANSALGQYKAEKENFYQFPVQPDRINYLSGSMGELRATHFHAGLDIKTNGREGLDIYAAADGYISRVRVSVGGYGNSIYIKHPNGTFTVYAHLQRFSKGVARYVLENQYKRESFEVNLFPKAGQFPVKKGDIIGYSGNTGSSGGPHLHFELRNERHEVLDPLRLRFTQIRDKIAPIPVRIALKTMDIGSRVNGQFGRFEFELERWGNEFVLTDTIQAYGRVGVEILAHDKLDGAANRNGIPIVKMFDDTVRMFSQNIDTINFADQKNILIHTNYQAQKETRRRYNKLYIDDGNTLGFYQVEHSKGVLQIQDTSKHSLKILLIDSYGNERQVRFCIKGQGALANIDEGIIPKTMPYQLDNTLQLFRKRGGSSLDNITVYTKAYSKVIGPAYSNKAYHVYLWDLRKGLPQEVMMGEEKHTLFYNDLVPPEVAHSYLQETYALTFEKKALFDTVYLRSRHRVATDQKSEILEVNNDIVPLKDQVTVFFKPKLSYDSLQQYAVYQINEEGKPSFVGGEWRGDTISFEINRFGNFTLMKDKVAPSIRYIPVNENLVSFSIKDEMSGIDTYTAKLNGKWLLMHYDNKRNLIWSEKLDKSKPLKGTLELSVTDKAGNISSFTHKLN